MDSPDFRLLFESSPGLYSVLDRQFRTLAVSDAYLRATMTRREDLIGRSVFETFPQGPDDPRGEGPAAVRRVFERALSQRSPQKLPLQRYDVPRPPEQGGGFERRDWMALVTPIVGASGEVDYLFCAVDNVTESEARYRTLFESIDAGFCVLEMIYDAQGRPADYRFLEVNPAFERQTGLSDATRKTMREHAPGHEQHWFDLYAQIAETGEPMRFVQEAKALQRWYEVSAFRLGGADSPRVGVLFNDITARLRAERVLRETAQRKDEFLATLAHELRNPLAPIANAVSLLRLREAADEELRMASEVIDRQVHHLVRLVDDLLDVSRINFGKVRLKRSRLDLRGAVRDAMATSEPLLAAAGLRLRVDLGDAPVWVDADSVRLAQVVSNLLNNAARYTAEGGEVSVRVFVQGGEARVSVQDNGIGIDAAMLDRIFDPFVQIERRDSAPAGGIGIGLALARALVQLHGGRIKAESAGRGEGSRFEISLPLAAPPRAASEDGASTRGTGRRFLVVDDNVDATVSQAALLRHLGHEVETAYSGPAAIEKARDFRPDVVLLDIGMPGMDGFEVARQLRAMPEARDALIVAQTGWGQEEDRQRTRAAGFDAHLAKPVDLGALMRLV